MLRRVRLDGEDLVWEGTLHRQRRTLVVAVVVGEATSLGVIAANIKTRPSLPTKTNSRHRRRCRGRRQDYMDMGFVF
ncbi:hypothetical protein DFP72DRAFT_1172421 [Ephemerocybe angulata]|uniref:Uncharacterized protein n=1 Tax=Ephemerocybe angulata TaxID=980116 RepID=A0A8H6HRG3_9AGAR|nr:hypothetical protein DFP72DRAFT_1172421 [Tulosesus angulatus]